MHVAELLRKPIGPRRFRRRHARPTNVVVVCAGDSITNGLMSANYVSVLQHDLGRSYDVVNAGVNGELAWNLLQRLDDIIACQPDVVTVLIGTNDAAAHIDESWQADYVKRQHLPQQPTLDWYEESLERIVTRFEERDRCDRRLARRSRCSAKTSTRCTTSASTSTTPRSTRSVLGPA